MRRSASRRLRIAVLITVTVLMAVVAGSAVALAGDEGELAGHHGPDPCELNVTKSLQDAPGGTKYSDFEVRVQYPDGTTRSDRFSNSGSHKAEFSVTQAGTYTVTEVNIPTGFTPSPASQTVTFSEQEISRGDVTKTVSITNRYNRPPEPCKIKVTKHLDNEPSGTDYDDFTAKVECPDGSTKTDDFSNSGSHAAYFSVTQVGTYTVTEVSIPEGFTPSPASQTVSFSADEIAQGDVTKEVSITNTYLEPSHSGSKTWSGTHGAEHNCLYGGNLHWILNWGGSGTVTEATLQIVFVGGGAADFQGYRPSGGGNGAMHFDSVGTAKVQSAVVNYVYTGSIRNVGLTISHSTCNPAPPVTGCITVHKTVVGEWPVGDPAGPEDFSVTIRNAAGQVVGGGSFDADGDFSLCGLQLGQYTVTENNPGPAWQVTYSSSGGVVNLGGVSLACTPTTQPPKPAVAHVDITNTLSLGSLLVHKTVAGKQYPDSPDSPVDFSVTVRDAQGQVVGQGSFDANGDFVLTGLVPGDYTVTEDDPGSGWEVTSDPLSGVVSVTGGSQAEVGITNERKLGSLLITKTITGDNPDSLVFEDFTVVVTGPAPFDDIQFNGSFDVNGEIYLEGLLPGTYTVTEAALGYPWTIQGNGVVEVLAGEEPALKEIVNTGSTTTSLATLTTKTTGTSLRTTITTARTTGTTVLGFTSVSDTVLGWVAQADNIQTGGGGTAGGNWGALIALVMSSTMLVGVLSASAVGVRRGIL